jgi:hypothetical protein
MLAWERGGLSRLDGILLEIVLRRHRATIVGSVGLCSGRQPETLANSFAHFFSIPQCRVGLAFGRIAIGTKKIRRILSERIECTPEWSKRCVMTLEEQKEPFQIVRCGNDRCRFLNKRLKVFFRTLLTIEARNIMER